MTIQATNAGQSTFPTGPINPHQPYQPYHPTQVPMTNQSAPTNHYEYINVLNRIAMALEKIVEKLGSGLD